MDRSLFTDIAFRSLNHKGERICGDNTLVRKYAMGRRTIVVLSDGMGHGIRANILSTFTSTMLLNFMASHEDMTAVARMILRMLPVNRSTNISYSTFTIADINERSGKVSIAQFDNPRSFLLRNGRMEPLDWLEINDKEFNGRGMTLHTTSFMAEQGDRLVMVSDGITQSGQKQGLYKFGWGWEGLVQFSEYTASFNHGITSADMASQIVSKANQNDASTPSDDMSCCIATFRKPTSMMLISCPPSLPEENTKMAEQVSCFEGMKIICGHPVANILAEELGLTLERRETLAESFDIPQYRLKGFEHVTEGIVIPNRILDILEHSSGDISSKEGLAGRIARTLLRHDRIDFVIGMRRNIELDPSLPDEFELRRNILRRLATTLEKKYSKLVRITYY